MSTEKKLRFETLQLHVGQENPDPATELVRCYLPDHKLRVPQLSARCR